MIILFIQICLIVLLLLLSAFFAGTETGIYRVSRFQIRVGREKGKSLYKMLFHILQDGQGLILSLLLGNNLVNNLLTALVTYMFLQMISQERLAGFYATAVLTPVLFIFGEMIPKNLFYYKANTLVPAMAWLNWLFYRLFTLTGAVWLLKNCSQILSRLFRLKMNTAHAVDTFKRRQVHQIIHETREEGLLTHTQKMMMSRLIDIPKKPVTEAMIKLRDVDMVSVDTDRPGLLAHLKNSRFTRPLVYQDRHNQILGSIHIYQILAKSNSSVNLTDEAETLPEIDQNMSVMDAIDRLQDQREQMALVTASVKRQKHPIGIITISDLIEEITGEFTI
ncbi:MAG: CNNM domain-containing protein [Planctomycetota bacterium]|jgi:CBS domain containing-hemolysin-like protein